MTEEEARFAAADATAAVEANRLGKKSGYYADLAHYCAMKIRGTL
jgi:hypothetical protein